jgi:hypothetical protein
VICQLFLVLLFLTYKRKKEGKVNASESNDSLLDMFIEISGDLKVVTNSVGKIA